MPFPTPDLNRSSTRWHCSLSLLSAALIPSPTSLSFFPQNLKQSNCLRQGSESSSSEWRMSRSLFIRVPHITLLLLLGFGTQPRISWPLLWYPPPTPHPHHKITRWGEETLIWLLVGWRRTGRQGKREGVNKGGKSCLDDQKCLRSLLPQKPQKQWLISAKVVIFTDRKERETEKEQERETKRDRARCRFEARCFWVV